MSMYAFKTLFITASACALLSACATSTTVPNVKATPTQTSVDVYAVTAQGIGNAVGRIQFTDTAQGLQIQTQLKQLPSGPRGFHIHENPSCAPAEKDGKMVAALSAGGHFNPYQMPNHGTPLTGHLGDLPFLLVETDGTAQRTLIAPRLKVKDILGRAVMIHAGGDNYSDHPKPLGGGGDRIACGVIQ